jgi:hypothetical protein
MKNFGILFFTFFIFNFYSTAQNVVERKVSMSLGAQNSYSVDVEGGNKKILEDVFKKMVKEYGKLQENKKAREFFMIAGKAGRINGSSPVDIYAKFEEGKGMATTYFWVDLGGAFVNSQEHQKQSDGIKTFMKDYYIECRRVVVQEELEDEEKNLQKLEKELSKLMKKNEDYHEDIEKAKEKIKEAEKNIEQNVVEQENKTKEIAGQKNVVEEVTKKLNNLGKD